MKLPELPKLIWQSPKFFVNSGLFLKYKNKRWLLIPVKTNYWM